VKKTTVIIRELKIIYFFTTHLQHQALDQLDIELLFYGMTLLPLSLQQSDSLSVFKNHLRCHLLSSISVFFIYIAILLQGINGLE